MDYIWTITNRDNIISNHCTPNPQQIPPIIWAQHPHKFPNLCPIPSPFSDHLSASVRRLYPRAKHFHPRYLSPRNYRPPPFQRPSPSAAASRTHGVAAAARPKSFAISAGATRETNICSAPSPRMKNYHLVAPLAAILKSFLSFL